MIQPRIDLYAVVENQLHQAMSLWCLRVFKRHGLNATDADIADEVDMGIKIGLSAMAEVMDLGQKVSIPPDLDYTPLAAVPPPRRGGRKRPEGASEPVKVHTDIDDIDDERLDLFADERAMDDEDDAPQSGTV